MLACRHLRPLPTPRLIRIQRTTTRAMHIQALPMWVGSSNNYAYLVTDEATKDSVIIDPAHPAEVVPTLQSQLSSGAINPLTTILNTHHHWDHAGGNKELQRQLSSSSSPSLPVTGGKDCEAVTRTPPHGSSFPLGRDIQITALHTPCHTQDSICYYFEDGSRSQRAVFTGDTLFIGGCGKFFEGTAAQMHHALNTVLAALPDDTRVYPGHEYTRANVKFLVGVDGANEKVRWLQTWADKEEVTAGKTTVGEEKGWNVFMRVGTEDMRRVTGKEKPDEVMARLREMKNNM